MHLLTVIHNGTVTKIPFEGEKPLEKLLMEAGLAHPHPCGGRGVCGKCAVEITGELSPMTEAERKAGSRLSCQTVLMGDATLTLKDTSEGMRIESESRAEAAASRPMAGKYGAAVDIGTTTVALRIYDLADGMVVGSAAALNPQRSVAADVMGRIDAACHGQSELLKKQITECIEALLKKAVAGREITVDALVLSGNTTMLYLLVGRDPSSLATAPFEADTLFDTETEILGIPAYLPPCMGAFVGADITEALLAGGICGKDGTYLLCDIGTNGEIALLKDGSLFVTSTAAGPAFEGVGISSGCMGISGAIDRVWAENGTLRFTTIDDQPPIGLCGSGLIDAVAAALSVELIDETGAMEEDEIDLGGILLLPEDVRALQLAKAAIAAGIDTLLDEAGVSADDIDECVIAGGFGSHLNPASAAAIGLLPATLVPRIRTIGNGSLDGASLTLLDTGKKDTLRAIAASAKLVNLGGNPKFNAYYIDKMMFE